MESPLNSWKSHWISASSSQLTTNHHEITTKVPLRPFNFHQIPFNMSTIRIKPLLFLLHVGQICFCFYCKKVSHYRLTIVSWRSSWRRNHDISRNHSPKKNLRLEWLEPNWRHYIYITTTFRHYKVVPQFMNPKLVNITSISMVDSVDISILIM